MSEFTPEEEARFLKASTDIAKILRSLPNPVVAGAAAGKAFSLLIICAYGAKTTAEHTERMIKGLSDVIRLEVGELMAEIASQNQHPVNLN